jgi:xanthine/CO dehydrogenase XdhC/CoxF family maturation factor
MRDIIEQIDAWREQGEEIALATVISAGGSTPRPIGAKMIVSRSGKMHGSVSGGCVEGAVIETAMQVLDSKTPQLVHYGISDEMAWDVGLSCGGEIEVFIEPLEKAAVTA